MKRGDRTETAFGHPSLEEGSFPSTSLRMRTGEAVRFAVAAASSRGPNCEGYRKKRDDEVIIVADHAPTGGGDNE